MFCNDNWRICCCSASQSCPTLCDTMDCNTPGFPVLHYLPEFAQTHVRWVGVAIQPSHPLLPPSPPALHLSQHQGLKRPWLFASGGQSIGALASASSLPMNIQGWFPLELTRIDWFDFFAVQGTLKSLHQYHNLKTSILQCSACFMVHLTFHTWLMEKP